MPKCAATRESDCAALRMRRGAMLAFALMFLLACVGCAQPQDESSGFRLKGDAMEAPVTDWSFTNAVQEIFVQTRTWYLIPHSTTIWCAEVDGQLYIGSYGPDGKKRWEGHVARNPKATVRVAGKLYDVTIRAVEDPDTTQALDAAYAKKYDMAEVFGDELPEWWYYRVAQRH